VALPGAQKVARMAAATPRLQVIAAIGPGTGLSGLATAGVKLRGRRFVGMERGALQHVPGETVNQRLQRHTQAPNPIGPR
jgi:hypothetical protein